MDLQGFVRAKLVPRTSVIATPELAPWFSEGETPQWKVRGLTGVELGQVRLTVDTGLRNAAALIEALAGQGDTAEAIANSAGISRSQVPQEVSRRIELIAAGSVSPEIGIESRDAVVKMCEAFPILFMKISDEIVNLSGAGQEPGKPSSSGKPRK